MTNERLEEIKALSVFPDLELEPSGFRHDPRAIAELIAEIERQRETITRLRFERLYD